MDTNLQHEDLLIKLRAKLNEEKVKLWVEPYILPDNGVSQSLKDLASKYALELSLDVNTILNALHELQIHSMERSKANTEYKETGCATIRVRANIPGEKPKMLSIQTKLDVMGKELMSGIAGEVGATESRIKLIYNGKIIEATSNLEVQGIKNGAQLMALVMAECPEDAKREDQMYREMKSTRDDAMLLSESIEDMADDDEYMRLEDQSGKAVDLPASEKRALLVGLALHERGRAAAKHKEYPLALLLFLEADKQLSDCRSSILQTVDNYAILQLDIAWCYLCVQNLSASNDAALRLQNAEAGFMRSYGSQHERLAALKTFKASERVLLMRLYLLQGILAYHQNKRDEARRLLERAEGELNVLKVDETSVSTLTELGWSSGQARTGLRATDGDIERAHHYLEERQRERDEAREKHKADRLSRKLGVCMDGTPVSQDHVDRLMSMGYSRRLATVALRNSNNHCADAVRLIQEQPEMLEDSELSTDDSGSADSSVEPDEKLVAELVAMGYKAEVARMALRLSINNISGAIDLLVAGAGHIDEVSANPSTSAGKSSKKQKRQKTKKERDQALKRLKSSINTEDEDYLDTALDEEQQFLVQYKSLL